MSENSYRILEADKIVDTVERLTRRVEERFPGFGLSKVAQHLLTLADAAEREAWALRQPILWVRAVNGLLILALIGLALGSLLLVETPSGALTIVDYAQVVESLINDAIFVGVGVFFLARQEMRTKRKQALASLHQLRSLAHIIDMHQLTKDPERLRARAVLTPSSPVNDLTAYELERYLDYCSEMLSLIGKIAALYVQEFDDEVVLASVDEIESLTASLSGKVWQKIMILNAYGEQV